MPKKTNCIKNGKKYYRISQIIGYDINGNPIKKDFYGEGYKEAQAKVNEYLNKLENGYDINFDKQTFNKAIKNWLFTIKRVSVKPSTFVSYEGTYRNYLSLSPFLNSKINDIKKINIQNYYNNLFNNGKSTEKIKQINKLLHSFFEYAIDEGYTIKNPCNKISIPKPPQINEDKIRSVFTEEEINYIIKNINGLKYEYVVLTAIYTRNA